MFSFFLGFIVQSATIGEFDPKMAAKGSEGVMAGDLRIVGNSERASNQQSGTLSPEGSHK